MWNRQWRILGGGEDDPFKRSSSLSGEQESFDIIISIFDIDAR